MSCQPRILDEIFIREKEVAYYVLHMMFLFSLTLARTDKDPCHDHKSDDADDHDNGYDQDDYFVQVQHGHNDVHHHDHDWP